MLLCDGGPAGPPDPKAPPFSAAQEVADAVAALDPELGAALATKGGEAAIKRAVANVPLNSCPHDDVLVALASQAARLGLLAIAGHCAQRCAAAPRLSSRVRSAYIKAVCLVGSLDEGDGPKQAGVYTKLMVNTRIDALKVLEEALTSARRVGEPELIQDGCVLIWNVALPLLQPSLRGHAERALYLAAAALEAIGSPLAQLRASVHLELARLDASRELVAKAAAHVGKAEGLNIPADAGTGAAVNPISRPLRMLGTRLALKLDVFREPATASERAMVKLEQARTDKRAPLKRTLLTQVLEELQAADPDPEDDAKGGDDENAKRERAVLWGELMKAGWALRMSAVARAAAAALLAPQWTPATDGPLVSAQAEAYFTLGETYISELGEMQEQAAMEAAALEAARATAAERGLPPPVAPPGKAEAAEAAREAVRQKALDSFKRGIGVGLSVKDDLLVHNGCIYVLNYNRSLLRAAQYEPLVPTLRACFSALQQCDAKSMKADGQQLRIALATCCSFALALEDAATEPPASGSGPRVALKDADAAAWLKEALDVCKWGCELCAGQAQLKAQLTACWARLQGYGGAKAAQLNVGTEPEATALALLELLACGILDTGPAADKAAALGKARELLTTSSGSPKPEPELWRSPSATSPPSSRHARRRSSRSAPSARPMRPS